MIQRLICLVLGYAFGLFQTGYLVGLANHRDIRNYGSGNSGTTNALRVFGKKAGALVFIGDFFKCFIACSLVKWASAKLGMADEQLVLTIYTGLGVVLGHNFPFYLQFKGGKGIASSWALSMVIDWRLGLVCIIIFVATVAISKYVSFASMLAIGSFALMWFVLLGVGALEGISGLTEASILIMVVVLLAIYRHKGNIKRLREGTENKIGQRAKITDEEKK